MTGDEYRQVLDFESNLKVGDVVTIKWTNCGSCWLGPATVTKVNPKSVRAALNESVGGPGYYSAGRDIIVPRLIMGTKWSVNNRVEPVGGY